MPEKMADLVEIDPARLCSGEWSHCKNRVLGEGDIAASYSADNIAYGASIRPPFHWQGMLMVNTGTALDYGTGNRAAYRLIPSQQFEAKPCTYRERVLQGDTARCDPNGFYHGMMVHWRGQIMILTGPPVVFVPGAPTQPDLFD